MVLKVALFGCGSIGCRHLNNVLDHNYADIVAYDPSASVCDRVSQKYNVFCSSTLYDIWKQQPNVALISAPTQHHITLAIEAAKRGCHLFIEKPLSYCLDRIKELVGIINERNLVTMVGCNMRFHPGPSTVKKFVDDNKIGQPVFGRIYSGSYLPNWRPTQNYTKSYSASKTHGGAILDCIHEIDLAIWYLGPARLESAVWMPAKAIELETDGLCELNLRHKTGALSSVHLNFIQRDYHRGSQIIGETGSIYWDFKANSVTVYDKDGTLSYNSGMPTDWNVNTMYSDELDHFFSAVRSHTQSMNSVDHSLNALEIAIQARHIGNRISVR